MVIVFLAMLLGMFSGAPLQAQPDTPTLKSGTLHSPDWSFVEGPPLELNGEWEVIWGKLVAPEEFDSVYNGNYFSLPARWNDVDQPGITGSFGSATFRAKIDLPSYNRDVSYHLIAPHSAYAVYINGDLVLQNGRVSETPDGFKASYVSRVFPGDSGTSEIVLHVSNFGHAYGGPGHVLTLWDSQRLALFTDKLSLVYGIVMGIMFTIGLFHLILFLADRRDLKNSPIHLWFSILCFIIVYRVQGVIPLFHEYFPEAGYWESLRLTYVSLYAAPAVYLLFFRSVFPQYFPNIFTKIILAICFIGVTATLFLPEYYYTVTRNFSIATNLFVIIYSLVFTIRAAVAKQAGSIVILIANSIFFLTALNDAFIYTDQGSGFDLTPFGILALGLGYSYALLLRLQRRFKLANDTSFALEQLNFDLERQVQDRTQAFEIAAIKAERASGDQARFIAAASHDLRQPLHALSMFNVALAAKSSGEAAKSLVEKQHAAISSLGKLLQDTLDTAQLDSQQKQPNLTIIDAAALCKSLQESFQDRAMSRGIKLVLNTEAEFFTTDPVILLRILGNLIDNAIKAARSNVQLNIELNDSNIIFRVEDDGHGISIVDARRIFNSYVTLSDALPDEKGGYGLGLYVVKRFTEILSGEISLNSKLNQGSQFRLTLPNHKLYFAGAPDKPLPENVHTMFSNVKVLAIDDDVAILAAMDAMLSSWGCKVKTARNLEDLDQIAEDSFTPDICLMDYHMPRTNGLNVNALLPSLFSKRIPVIIITGVTEPEILNTIASNNITVIEKPVNPFELSRIMKTKLDETGLNRE